MSAPRNTVSFAGNWQFQLDPDNRGIKAGEVFSEMQVVAATKRAIVAPQLLKSLYAYAVGSTRKPLQELDLQTTRKILA